MKAIAGVFFRNRRPASGAASLAMLDAMPERARHSARLWTHRSVELAEAFAFGQRAAVPALYAENGLTLVADARLDNRSELCRELNLRPEASDAAVLAAAYRTWGAGCPEHLLGDFCFAVWDEGREQLVLVRDHFGAKPLYYIADDSRLAFASELNGLLNSGMSRASLNDVRIADYLAGTELDPEATFYADIKRLPPRHCLVVGRDRIRREVYWSPRRQTPPPAREVPEAFRALFEGAVRCRVAGAARVGSMLSGGLDSSSIACVTAPLLAARGGRLPVFSLCFEQNPELGEDRFIDVVARNPSIDVARIGADDYRPLDNFGQLLSEQGQPFLAQGLAMTRRLYQRAAADGVDILFNGHGGDEVVSHGFGRLNELLHRGRALSLWRECRGVAALDNVSAPALYMSCLRRHPAAIRARRWAGRARRMFGLNGAPRGAPYLGGYLNAGLATRSSLAERLAAQARAARAAALDEASHQAFVVTSPLQAHAFEVLDRAACANGVEPRYPFWDRRLLEFCLSLPSDQKLDGGWSRLVLRRAMEGILPKEIQWRRDKLDFGPQFNRGLVRDHQALIADTLKGGTGLEDFADLPAARAAFERLSSAEHYVPGRDAQDIWRTVSLGLWLKRMNAAARVTPAKRERGTMLEKGSAA